MGVSGSLLGAFIGGGVAGSLLLICCVVAGVVFARRGKSALTSGPEFTRTILFGLCFL
jgi:hypothetical protein